MIWRPHRLHKPWWDTDFCRSWELTGFIARMWGGLFAYLPPELADNDRDHCWW